MLNLEGYLKFNHSIYLHNRTLDFFNDFSSEYNSYAVILFSFSTHPVQHGRDKNIYYLKS